MISARGEVKSLFKSEDVDKYPVEAEETDDNLTEAVLSDPPIEKEPKKKPQEPIRRKEKKAIGRPRRYQEPVAASGAPPG